MTEDDYAPGICNIGPAEIRKRRRGGHVAALATCALLAILIVADAPRTWRILLAAPAALAAVGYIQAFSRFCLFFGFRGDFNFGDLGATEKVMIAEARAADRRKSATLTIASAAVGLAIALAAMKLPF